MKYFILFILAMSVTSSSIAVERHSSTNEEILKKEVEVFDTKPTRPYTLISPISADKESSEKAFERLKEKAQAMNADAIIDFSCQAGEKIRTGLLQIKTIGVSASCQGLAVKWK